MPNQDRRIQKTRKAIYEAFSGLLQKKKYSAITIQEIIDEANVGRSTFYSHFETKDELLYNMCDDIFESIHINVSKDASGAFRIPISYLLQHLLDNKKIIVGIFHDECYEYIIRKYKSKWREMLKQHFIEEHPQANWKVPIEFLINHVISSAAEMIRWWVDTGMKYEPIQMEQYWFALITPAIMSAV